jgi:hypothetical protein
VPVLTTRHLNRALLARQCLLRPSRGSLVATVERVAGLQAQYAPSAYVGLWSRLERLRRDQLTTALERRRVVQATLMRATIHVVSARDHQRFTAGVRASRREQWTRLAPARGLAHVDFEALGRVVRRELEAGPRTRADLVAAVTAAGAPKEAWEGVGLWVDMVRVPPSGTWARRRADLHALAEDWIDPGGVTEAATTEQEGIEHLMRRYLWGFGPARPSEAANWAGVTVGAIQAVMERLPLRRFRAEDGTDLVDLPRGPLPDPGTPAPVRFLPTWDATLLVHARRAGILPEEYRPVVFSTKNPHSTATFLVDGSVAGTWRAVGREIRTQPFHPLPRAVAREVEREADRLAAFHVDGHPDGGEVATTRGT